MNPPGKATGKVRRVRRVRKRKGVDTKPHAALPVTGMNTERILQQIKDGETVSWEGEYRDD